jgi:RimJ/RimL family protein N-acetyltransferase
MIPVLATERLALGPLGDDDAPFLVELLTDPAFLRFVGDRGVRSEADVPRYLEEGPRANYRKHGFGLYRVSLREAGEAIGVCGLIRRPALSDVDLGFALLPRFRGRGYALEAARRVARHAFEDHGLNRLIAITDPDNQASIRVLERIGMGFAGMVRLGEEEPELRLYATKPASPQLRARSTPGPGSSSAGTPR